MDPALENFGWTEEQWNRICTVVTEEAQRARVAAQILPAVGPELPSTVAVPSYALTVNSATTPPRLEVSSDPTLYLTTISVLVELGNREVSDSGLAAALTMFRRAANVVARAEDALVFNGRTATAINDATKLPKIFGINTIPAGFGGTAGIMNPPGPITPVNPPAEGSQVVDSIFRAIGKLDSDGFSGPYACALDQNAFDAICTPTPSFVLPRDRILPVLQGGGLVRASAIPSPKPPAVLGAVVALAGSPVELVVAADIGVCFLQTTGTTDPRRIFRVSERVALRIKDHGAIAIIAGDGKPGGKSGTSA